MLPNGASTALSAARPWLGTCINDLKPVMADEQEPRFVAFQAKRSTDSRTRPAECRHRRNRPRLGREKKGAARSGHPSDSRAWALAESGAERCPQSGADTLRHMAIPSSSAGRVPARSRKPGRPRNPATDGAILDACIDQLDQVGYRALSLSEVARSAGVGKPTLYRRWSSKPELVIATLLHRYGDQPVPDTGSLRGDLIEAQRHTTQLLSDPSTVHVLVALLADLSREPDLDQLWRRLFLAPRRASFEAALRHARERGEWRSDLSTTWAADWLTGPLLSHVLFSRGRLGRRDIERSVDRFIAAFSHT